MYFSGSVCFDIWYIFGSPQKKIFFFFDVTKRVSLCYKILVNSCSFIVYMAITTHLK